MEMQEFKSADPILDLMSTVYYEWMTKPASPYNRDKQKDEAKEYTTIDKFIDIMIKANLIKLYQAETLKLINSVPEIPIHFHRPERFSLRPLDEHESMKPPGYNLCIDRTRHCPQVIEFNVRNKNGRLYKSFSYWNVLSMKEREKLGI